MYYFLRAALWTGIVYAFFSCSVQKPNQAQSVLPTDSLSVAQDTAVFENPILDQRNIQWSDTRSFDLRHTKLDLFPVLDSAVLHAQATLELSPLAYPQSQVSLDAVGFLVERVARIEQLDTMDLYYEYDGEAITAWFDRDFTPGEKMILFISYVAQPEKLPVTTGEAIKSDKGLYFIDPLGTDPVKPTQIWTQNEPEAASKWFPTFDAPNYRCTQEIYLTVDTAFQTLSNGLKIFSRDNGDGTRTDYWKMDLPHAPYLFMIAVGQFSIIEDQWKNVPLQYFVEAPYAEHAGQIFGRTKEMMDFYSTITKMPYPWPKYAQIPVRDYVSGAMENTTASVFLEDIQITSRELIDYNYDDIIAHELFHQWFGNVVTCESWSNITLNEAFATYGEYLWNEHFHGPDEASLWWMDQMEAYLDEFATEPEAIIRYEYERIDDLFDANSYSKGALVIHMLRNYLGDDVFVAGIQSYLKKHRFSAVELSDLRKVFEEVSGQDLQWFFDQWFLFPGHPVLEVEHEYDSGMLTVSVRQIQDLTVFPLYRLPLYLDIWSGDSLSRFPIEIWDEEEVYEVTLDQEPLLVLFDSEQQLIGEIYHPKTTEELAFQYYHAGHLVSRWESIEYFSEDLSNDESASIVLDAFRDPHWSIRVQAVNAFLEYDGALLDNVQQALVDLINEDSKSDVRGAAIAVLASTSESGFSDMYKACIEDSSYYVSSEALYAYLSDTTHADRNKLLEKYMHAESSYYMFKIAEYLATYQVTDHYDWFLNQLGRWDGIELWSVVYYLNQLNFVVSESTAAQSIPKLSELAMNNEDIYVRLAATQGILQFEHMDQVPEMLREIRENEQNPRLLEIYETLF
jgi:aminopeptidase N